MLEVDEQLYSFSGTAKVAQVKTAIVSFKSRFEAANWWQWRTSSLPRPRR